MHTPAEIAAYMVAELERERYLSQDMVVYQISEKFGEEFTPLNDNGNLSIRRDVLAAFKKLTGDDVVWERGERLWRKREQHDEPGRRQA
jgi:hypothetical protein